MGGDGASGSVDEKNISASCFIDDVLLLLMRESGDAGDGFLSDWMIYLAADTT